jgi:hypothetical protein
MTPREPYKPEEVTWDGVSLMIRTYDQEVIEPRQLKQHQANLEVQNEHTILLNQWKGSVSMLKWMLTFAIGVGTIIIMILGYEHETRHSLLQSSSVDTYAATQNAVVH